MKHKREVKVTGKLHYWLLGAIFALSLLLRIIGINWGLPNTNLHPDEGIIFIKAYECALERTFEVSDYYYRPNHVLIKLNTLLYIGIQDLYFEPQGLEDFSQNYNDHISLFIIASRVLIALFGVGTVILAYFIVRNFGKKQALFASMLFAVFPAFLEHSHYITPDVPLLFFMMCVLLTAIHYIKKPSTLLVFLMAIFSAFGTCEKFPGAFCCLIIAVSVCVTHYKKPLMIVKEGVLAILFYIIGIMAISPILVIDYKDVLTAIAGQNGLYHIGGDGLNFPQTLWYYVKETCVHAGLLLSFASVYGCVKAFRENWKVTSVILTFLVYIIPISTLHVHWERYALPLYALVIILGTLGLFYAYEAIYKLVQKNKALTVFTALILFLLPAFSQFAGSVAITGSFLAPDNRIALKPIFERMGIDENNACGDCNTPLDPGGYYGVFCNFEDADPARYKYGRVTYVVTSASQRDEFLNSNQEIYGGVATFYRRLDDEYELVGLFTTENPSSHFLELSNMYYAARTVHRYMRGAFKGFEIRVYRIM